MCFAGLDVNIGIQGLESLPDFIDRAAVCDSEHAILATLSSKTQSAERVCKDFLTHGLRDHLMRLWCSHRVVIVSQQLMRFGVRKWQFETIFCGYSAGDKGAFAVVDKLRGCFAGDWDCWRLPLGVMIWKTAVLRWLAKSWRFWVCLFFCCCFGVCFFWGGGCRNDCLDHLLWLWCEKQWRVGDKREVLTFLSARKSVIEYTLKQK